VYNTSTQGSQKYYTLTFGVVDHASTQLGMVEGIGYNECFKNGGYLTRNGRCVEPNPY
jgi:hypothetical protein